jgi:multisubunit Na+/H+ antiporter MnhC subunit
MWHNIKITLGIIIASSLGWYLEGNLFGVIISLALFFTVLELLALSRGNSNRTQEIHELNLRMDAVVRELNELKYRINDE